MEYLEGFDSNVCIMKQVYYQVFYVLVMHKYVKVIGIIIHIDWPSGIGTFALGLGCGVTVQKSNL